MEHAGVVILGTGHGCAGRDGSVLMIGRNTATPREHPLLSTEYPAGRGQSAPLAGAWRCAARRVPCAQQG